MIHLLLSPLTWALLGLLALLGARSRRMKTALGLVTGTAMLAMAPVGANALVWLLERQASQLTTCPPGDDSAIVVLMGGYARVPDDRQDFTALSHDALWRLRAAAEVARTSPEAIVIVTGGPAGTGIAEATVGASLLQAWGLPSSRLVIEPEASNTEDNAHRVRPLLPDGADHVRLVTSALHLPRATEAFSRAGIKTCAQSAGSAFIGPDGIGYFVPQATSIAKTHRVLHEVLGLVLQRAGR